MEIKGKLSFDAIENSLARLEGGAGSELDASYIDVVLPGVESAFTQFVATWAQAVPDGSILLPSEALKILIRPFGTPFKDYVLAAIGCAGVVKDSDGIALPVRDLQRAALRSSSQSDLPFSEETPEVTLASFTGQASEFSSVFYTGGSEPKLRDRSQFAQLVKTMLDCCLASNQERQSIIGNFELDLGRMLYELVENTHFHARTDIANAKYHRGIRCVSMRRLEVPLDQIDQSGSSNPAFLLYLNKRRIDTKANQQVLRFLELDVFDSGPGLALRLLSEERRNRNLQFSDISIDEETTAVSRCFKKYVTTKPHSSAGIGLTLVIKLLAKLDGFLRIRTGRICLAQSFDLPHKIGETQTVNLELVHWYKGRAELAPASGTSITLLFYLG